MADTNIDLGVLRMLKRRDRYDKYLAMIPDGTLNAQTKSLLKHFGAYFATTDANQIVHNEFWPYLRSRYPKWKQTDADVWHAVTKPIDGENPLGYDEQLMENLLTTRLGLDVVDAVERWSAGDEVHLPEFLQERLDDFGSALQRKTRHARIGMDFDDMLAEDEDGGIGLAWRLQALNNVTRPLKGGDFGIIAARPDRGKTTMLASEVTFMAPQIETVWGRRRPILWLNNEGPGRRINSRVSQSATGLSVSERLALGPDGAKDAYIQAVGDVDAVRVFDIHGYSSYDVEDLIRKQDAALVVFDMIDNINFVGGTLNHGERTDQMLEAMYQAARGWCVKYDCIGLATSQISDAGEGMQYPMQNMLKDSRCFAAGTPVRMADGSVRAIETIEIGEQVMGIDGTPRNVVGLGSGQEQMYRVSGWGWSFDCNASHNLVVQNPTGKKTAGLARGEVRDMSLREFMQHPSYQQRLAAVRCRIPYKQQQLPLDPYYLGLWLGDGASRSGRITTADVEIEQWLLQNMPVSSVYQQKNSAARDVQCNVTPALRELGVLNNKHIPGVYKRSSIEQRKRLLAGLQDSDGYVDHGGMSITLANLFLIQDVQEVARSLGYRCRLRKSKPNAWTLSVQVTEELPVLLARRRPTPGNKQDTMTVEPLGWGNYYGITVDGDSRYCHADYIALRNTGKQGACDFIVTIGFDPNTPNTRYIGMTKNKIKREGANACPRAPVRFDADRGRFVMPTMED